MPLPLAASLLLVAMPGAPSSDGLCFHCVEGPLWLRQLLIGPGLVLTLALCIVGETRAKPGAR